MRLKVIIGIIFIHQFFGLNSFAQISEVDNKIHTIVIDAGHGGKDSGALGKNSQEKNIALSISLKVGKYIEEKMPDVKVIYTRTTDVFVPLHERAQIANDNDADLFVSIHVNSNDKSAPYGTSSHVLGLHRMEENFEVAKKENSVILMEEDYQTRYENFDPNSPESYIMFSLMQNVYFDQSLYFSQKVQDQFRERAQRKDRGVKQQGLLVLAQTSMPGVLIETGFISNPAEEKYLMSDSGQDYIASAIFRAFREYKEHIEGGSNSLATYHSITESSDNTDSTDTGSASNDNKTESKTETPVVSQESTTVNTEEKVTSETPKATSENSQEKKEIQSSNNPIIYKVQILYSEKPVKLNDDTFKDFNDVQEIEYDGKYKYVVGNKSDYQEAIEYSKWVKSRHPDAFIVAVSNGKIIPLSQALKQNQNN